MEIKEETLIKLQELAYDIGYHKGYNDGLEKCEKIALAIFRENKKRSKKS